MPDRQPNAKRVGRRLAALLLILTMLLPAFAGASGSISDAELRRQRAILRRVNRYYSEIMEPYSSVEQFINDRKGLIAFYQGNIAAMKEEFDKVGLNIDTTAGLIPTVVTIGLEELKDFSGLIDWALQKSVDAAEEMLMDQLRQWSDATLPPMTLAEFIYAQLPGAEKVIYLEDTQAIMEIAENNGGRFTDIGDAISFANAYLRDETGIVTLELGSNFYFERKRESMVLRGVRVVEDVLLSLMTQALSKGNKAVSFVLDRLVSRLFKAMDYIATAYKDPVVNEWTRELKEIEYMRAYLFLMGIFANPEDWEEDGWEDYDDDAWDSYYDDFGGDSDDETVDGADDGDDDFLYEDGLVERGPEYLDEYLGIWELIDPEGSSVRLSKDETGAYVLDVSIYRIAAFEATYSGVDEGGLLLFESADGQFYLALYQDWMSLSADVSDEYFKSVFDFSQEFICVQADLP